MIQGRSQTDREGANAAGGRFTDNVFMWENEIKGDMEPRREKRQSRFKGNRQAKVTGVFPIPSLDPSRPHRHTPACTLHKKHKRAYVLIVPR